MHQMLFEFSFFFFLKRFGKSTFVFMAKASLQLSVYLEAFFTKFHNGLQSWN